MRLEIDTKDSGIGRALNAYALRCGNTAPLMRTVANTQMRSTMRNFETQSFDGKRWKPLSPTTAMRRVNTVGALVGSYRAGKVTDKATGRKRSRTADEVEAYRGRVLAERASEGRGKQRKLSRIGGRSRLRGGANILHPTGRHLMQRIHQSSTDDEARVACGTPWAWVHNFGARLRSAVIPQRTFMGITDADIENIIKAAWDHVSRGR